VKTACDVWTDPELEELVRSEPELAAIADALAQAGAAAARPRRLRAARLLVAVAALAAAFAVALVAPWERSTGSLSDAALAAIGSQPVLHVVATSPRSEELIDLASGASRPVVQREEIWYHAGRGLKRTLVTIGGTVTGDTLETPQGGFTPDGIVYDCAWIAAHPVAATKAGVSCDASGENGTTPRVVPRPKPALTPGLAGFVDGYRQALVDGRARDGGSGALDGRPVDWLVLPTSRGSKRVALDRETHRPLLLEDGAGWRLTIEAIETVSYDSADFARPRPDELPPRPSHTRAADGPAVPLAAEALAAAMPRAVWAGRSVGDLPLVHAEQQALEASFARGAQPAAVGPGLELVYGTLTGAGRVDRSRPYVLIDQAPSAVLATMWGFVRGGDPPPGQLYLATGPDATWQTGFTVANGVYVTIQATDRELLLRAARALEPAS
jgi:hypothetical protein